MDAYVFSMHAKENNTIDAEAVKDYVHGCGFYADSEHITQKLQEKFPDKTELTQDELHDLMSDLSSLPDGETVESSVNFLRVDGSETISKQELSDILSKYGSNPLSKPELDAVMTLINPENADTIDITNMVQILEPMVKTD